MTVEKIAIIITPLLVAIVGLVGRVMLKEIHVLVNSRLDVALAEIKALKQKLGIPDTSLDKEK